MKVLFKKGLCLLCVVALLMSGVSAWAATTTENPKVYILGDSTACRYYPDEASTRLGWGQALQNFFSDPYMISNWAKSGDAAKRTYDNEYLWGSLKTQIKKGDYLLIQFGINDDDSSDPERYTVTTLDHTQEEVNGEYSFKWYLYQFIKTAHDAGAHPILVTSVENGKTDDNAATEEAEAKSGNGIAPYAYAMEELSKTLKDESVMGAGNTIDVPVIDVWRAVRAALNEKGNAVDSANETYNWYVNSSDIEGEDGDYTHLNETGAMAVAKMFADLVKASGHDVVKGLAEYLVENTSAVTEHTVLSPNVSSDFEEYDFEDGEVVRPGLPFEIDGTLTEDKYAQVVKENAGTADENNCLKLTHGSTTGINYLYYRFFETLSDGYYKLKYRFRSDGDTTNMVFVTQIGTYSANTRYAKNSINKSGGDNLSQFGIDLTEGEWVEVEFYLSPANGKMDIFCEGNNLSAGATGNSKLKNLQAIRIGFTSSGVGSNAKLYLDDIEFRKIEAEEYARAFSVLPDITAIEDFETGSTAEEKIGTTNYGWVNQRGSSNTDKRVIEYAVDPTDSDNMVARFESWLQELTDYNTLSFTTPLALSNGIYSVKFRLYAEDTDSNTFWLSAMNSDTSMRHYIAFAMGDDETYGDKVYLMTTENGSTVEYAKAYNFNIGQWYDIEVVYDLTPENKIAASVYVGDTKVINGVTIGGVDSYKNDGTIGRFDFGIPGGTTVSTTATELTGDDTVWASFLVDDIKIIEAVTRVTGVTQANGKVTALSAYVGNAGANQKFIVAAYGEDANGKAILKGVTTAKATETGTKTVALTNPLSVESGDTIKVYHWNMAELVPFSSVYSTTAQ